MKPKEKMDRGGVVYLRLLIVVIIFLGIPLLLFAASGPAWWYNPSLTPSGTTPAVSGSANDYAVANQGQVKNLAVTAVNELNTALAGVGGAGSGLNNLAVSLTATSGSTNDFAAINLGQLKAVAKPFYDRLFSIDYAGPPLTSSTYPWLTSGLTANDYSVANIGQVKDLFSFDLTYSSDGSPLPNWWRQYYFGTLSVSSTATVPLNGGAITYLQTYQERLSPLPGPAFSPLGGVFRSSTAVTISATGATAIYYTTNGSDPAVSGSLYTTSIPVSGFETLRAIAYDGTAATEESTAVYSFAGNPTALAAGAYHSLEIKGDGTVWAWGANCEYGYDYGYASNDPADHYAYAAGQLGIGSYVDQWYPTQVSLPLPAISIAAGCYHSLAVTSDGQVWAWGYNDSGQIGIPSTNSWQACTTGTVAGAVNTIAVAAGTKHSVALTSSGAVLTWGDNSYGELGINSDTSQSSPGEVVISGTPSMALGGVVAVAAGGYSTAALTSGSAVWMWGDNTYGKCCQSAGSSYQAAIEVTNTNITSIVAVAVGTNHVLALRSDGTVWAWGYNTNGQLGNGSTTSTNGVPVQVLTGSGTLTGIVSIAAGNTYSLAVKGDGTVWAWGNLDYGLISNTTVATQLAGVSGAIIAAAGLHALIGSSNGSITAYGENSNGELGLGYGTVTSSTTPLLSMAVLTPQPPAPSFSPDGGIYAGPQTVTVSCTDSAATIYYTTDGSTPGPTNGSIIDSGQSVNVEAATILRAAAVAGNVSSQIKSAAYHMGYQVLAAGGSDVNDIGSSHSVLLDTDGTVYTWGSNCAGQLGLGWDSGDQVLPQLVTGLSGSASSIAAGEFDTAAVVNSGTNLGTVWVWGYNDSAQCSVAGTTDCVNTPVQIPGITGAVAVACGWNHTVAIMGSGTMMAWGSNFDGELGNGNNNYETSPVAVTGLSGVKAIAAGDYHTLALSGSGTVYAWGYNTNGELGNATTSSTNAPVQVLGLSNIVEIAASQYSSFALRSDGTVWAWGLDTEDALADDLSTVQLGSENLSQALTPVLVGTLRDVVAIAAGTGHNLALLGNGTIVTWGQNVKNALTSAVPVNEPSLPVPVPGFTLTQGTTSLASVVTMVSAGDYHSLAVLNTLGVQTLWGWGDNTYGELGDGTTNSRYAPAMVQFSGYANAGNDGMPNWLALTIGLNPFVPLTNNNGIPPAIQVADGLGLNPSLPYTPYTLPIDSGTAAPVITITIPVGATLY